MGKLATPNWILKGGKKPKEKKTKGKTFKIRRCPKCNSDEVAVLLGNEEGKGKVEWECKKCKWKGENIQEEELNEDEFLKLMGKMNENKKS